MNRIPNEPDEGGQDHPIPNERTEKGPYRFPSKEDDPDRADDEPTPPVSDPDDEKGTQEDLDATGRFRVIEQLNLPKRDCW